MNPLAVVAVEAAKHALTTRRNTQSYPATVSSTSTGSDGTTLATIVRNGATTAVTIPTVVTVAAGDRVLVEYQPSGVAFVFAVI